MFTNWLTSSPAKMTITNSRIDGGLIDGNSGGDKEIVPLLSNLTGSNSNNNNALEFVTSSNMINCRPDPDILIEVSGSGSSSSPGSGSNNIRFMAHGIIISAHSGYLRSAIRMDDHFQSSSSAIAAVRCDSTMAMTILYLNNVTAEQFGPLLNYMYTGYLDLNVENIFGILLATHVLHMPRALEICRGYLAQAESNGYFQSSLNNNNPNNNHDLVYHYQNNNNHAKVIRPIPSKPPSSLTSLRFLPSLTTRSESEIHHQTEMSISPAVPDLATAIERQRMVSNIEQLPLQINGNDDDDEENGEVNGNVDTDEDIDVDEVERQSLSNVNYNGMTAMAANEDGTSESEELFIDSNSEKDNETSTNNLQKTLDNGPKEPLSQQQLLPVQLKKNEKNLMATACENGGVRSRRNRRHGKKKSSYSTTTLNSCGLQIAKAAVPISQCPINNDIATIQSDVKKVIIDVASCDGPVRFKRILNTAYGQTSNNLRCPSLNDGNMPTKSERSQKSLSLSFHQQMAKTISQHHQNHNQPQQQQEQQQERQQRYLQQCDELENSEETTSTDNCSNSLKVVPMHRKMNEIFVCIYCNHTFKSQYCYQKHAKRHLNPLNLPVSNTTTSSYANNTPSTEECIEMNKTPTTLITAIPIEQQQQQQQNQITNINALGSRIISTTTTTTTTTTTVATAAATTIMHCNQSKRPLYRKEITKHQNHNYNYNHHHFDSSKLADLEKIQTHIKGAAATRDMKPLDMNVQYFPCKTCGCKFPSYYFVHKHRKMCHADEESLQQQQQQQHQHQEQHHISISNKNNNSMTKAAAATTNVTFSHSTAMSDKK